MRWKFTRDGGNMYICCGCIHVRTGTVFLGLATLLIEVAFVLCLGVMFLRPDVVPQWMSCFMQPSADDAKLRPRRAVGSENDQFYGMMPNGRGARGGMMGDGRGPGPGMMGFGRGGMMGDDEGIGNMMDGPASMMGGKPAVKPTSTELPLFPKMPMMEKLDGSIEMPMMDGKPVDWSDMPHMKDASPQTLEEMARLMKESGMPRNIEDMPHSLDEMAKHMEDPRMPQTLDEMAKHMQDMSRDWVDEMGSHMGVKVENLIPDKTDDDDDRPLISDSNVINMPFRTRFDAMSNDDKLFAFVITMCCIAASVLLVYGVIKGYPGYMMPFMGLQVFNFCAACLVVFTCFSYVPNIKHWISELPDTFPWKGDLMAVNTDRLMLSIILFSVSILIFKAYMMGMVWSCYKYLTQLGQQATHRRSCDEDISHNPEDSELLLPPKYEDIMIMQSDAVSVTTEPGTPQPPPYTATTAAQ